MNGQVIRDHPTEVGGRVVKNVIWNEKEVYIVDREIAVKIDKSVSMDRVYSLLEELKAELVRDFNILGWSILKVPESSDEIAIINEIKEVPFILAAEPNMVHRAGIVPIDPHFTKQ